MPSSPAAPSARPRRAEVDEGLRVIASFESEASGIRAAADPLWARATVLTLAGMLVATGIVAGFTRLDRIVTSTSGRIVSTDQITVFGALDSSLVKTIDAREGDEVQKGQLLATLDPTFAAADVNQLKAQIGSLQAQVARDEALLSGTPWIPALGTDPAVGSYAMVQKNYYDQQVAQYNAQLASFDAKIESTKSTITKYHTNVALYQDRVTIAQKIETMRTILAEHGTGTQLNALVSKDSRLEVARSMAFDQNSLAESQHTLASLVADREAFIRQWSTQVSQDLVTTRNSLDTALAQIEKANRHKDLVRITAPDRSVVLTLADVSVGSVLKEGETMFTLMPADKPVAAEIQIGSRDIGFIRSGDHCSLKIDAFNVMEHGTADGVVQWISDNAFTTSPDGKPVDPYYKARCRIDAMHFINTPPNFRLIPGMTLQADVKVGTRSVAMYLLGGLMRGVNESMREP